MYHSVTADAVWATSSQNVVIDLLTHFTRSFQSLNQGVINDFATLNRISMNAIGLRQVVRII